MTAPEAAMTDTMPRDHWSVDRKVPIALIATIVMGGLVHTLSFAWAASNLWTRVGELERRAEMAEPLRDRMTRLEGKADTIATTLQEIKALIRSH
jgi:hypothetical protein